MEFRPDLSSTSGAGINSNGDDSVRVRNGKFGWTSVPTNSMVNVFRFGVDTDRQADSFDQAELGSGLGYLDVSVGGVQLGPVNYLPRVEVERNPARIRGRFHVDQRQTYAEGRCECRHYGRLYFRRYQRRSQRGVHLPDCHGLRPGLYRRCARSEELVVISADIRQSRV